MPHSNDGEIAVGIDLGTTNSLVAIVADGKPQILTDEKGNGLLPSIVAYLENGAITTGHAAKAHGTLAINSIKRLMGKGAHEVKKIAALPYELIAADGALRLNVAGKHLTAVEISAEILKSLRNVAENALQRKVTKAVITVPAYFDDAARTATKDAARLAGLEVLRLVNEPTAAALAYGLDKAAEGIYAIYDLGGGTFDISVLKLQQSIFQVLATGGSVEIGGDDFDKEVAEIFLWQCRNKSGMALLPSPIEWQNLLQIARKAKEYLTDHDQASCTINLAGQEFAVTISAEQLEQAMEPYISATLDISQQVLADAQIETSQISGVVLVGGATRSKFVRKMVQESFDKKPLADINPDEVVVCGAALQAEGLTKGSNNLLLDVIPLSLGLEMMGGLVEKIIPRNTPIPVAKSQEFTTYQDGQTGLVIHVLQGEREMSSQNRSLAKFTLSNIPPMKAGMARIKITFAVDADGMLNVSAIEETTGTQQTIVVKPSYGLDEDEIKTMLLNSMKHGAEDMATRLLEEAKLEARRLIIALDSGLKEDQDLLDKQELANILNHKQQLQTSLNSTDRESIITATTNLETSATDFSTRRMNKHIADSLKGRKIGAE